MKLNSRVVSWNRVWKSAFSQAFVHWHVIVTSLSALYIVIATFWLLAVLAENPSASSLLITSTTSMFDTSKNSTLMIFIQFNVVCNYLVGVATVLIYAVYMTVVGIKILNKCV